MGKANLRHIILITATIVLVSFAAVYSSPGLAAKSAADGSAIQVAAGEVAIADNGRCSLIEALENGMDEVTGRPYADCSAGSTDIYTTDTIVLAKDSTYILMHANYDYEGPTALPQLRTRLVLEGNGAVLERQADESNPFRIISIGWDEGLHQQEIRNLTFRGGLAERGGAIFAQDAIFWLTGCRLESNAATGQGGAIYLDFSALYMRDSLVNDNSAVDRGGGIHNDGYLKIRGGEVSNNQSEGYGGGIYNDISSYAVLTGVTLHKNEASTAGAIASQAGTEYLLLSDVQITENSATGWAGGGIFHFDGLLQIVNSNISGNTAEDFGGGLAILGLEPVLIRNSTITDNKSLTDDGGGLYVSDDFELKIRDSAIVNNSADLEGGGLFIEENQRVTIDNSLVAGNEAWIRGGGIRLRDDSVVTIRNSTISDNKVLLSGYPSDTHGGGLHVPSGSKATVINATIVENHVEEGLGGGIRSAGEVTLVRSLVSGNTAASGSEISAFQSESVILNGQNLLGLNGSPGLDGLTPGATDIVPSPGTSLANILAPLAANGGFADTHALVAGSPAIDAAASQGCLDAGINTDQRHYARSVDGDGISGATECDIGAFEYASTTTWDDGDGVEKSVEDAAPNDGDGNNDGVPDSQQWHVASLPNSVTGDYLTLEIPSFQHFTNVRTMGSESPGESPVNSRFPIGLVAFNVYLNVPGFNWADVLLTDHGEHDFDTYYKVTENSEPDWYEFLWRDIGDYANGGAELKGNEIELHFWDGRKGDGDGQYNSVIVDPGGPVVDVEESVFLPLVIGSG